MVYRADLMNLHKDSQTDYDRTIVTICSGALAATIGFFDKLPSNTPVWGILVAWTFWSLGLIFIIASFAGSVNSLAYNLANLDKYLSKNNKRNYVFKQTIWDKVISMANRLSFGFLVLGILVFAGSIGWGVMNKNNNVNEQTTKDRNERTQRATTPTIAAQNQSTDKSANDSRDGRKNDAAATTPSSDQK